jgi:hypothetical protein
MLFGCLGFSLQVLFIVGMLCNNIVDNNVLANIYNLPISKKGVANHTPKKQINKYNINYVEILLYINEIQTAVL